MPYRLQEDEQIQLRASRLFVRDRARYEEVKVAILAAPYPHPGNARIRRLDFGDGLTIFSYEIGAFQHSVLYTVHEPDPHEDYGVVRIVALIDRRAEQRR